MTSTPAVVQTWADRLNEGRDAGDPIGAIVERIANDGRMRTVWNTLSGLQPDDDWYSDAFETEAYERAYEAGSSAWVEDPDPKSPTEFAMVRFAQEALQARAIHAEIMVAKTTEEIREDWRTIERDAREIARKLDALGQEAALERRMHWVLAGMHLKARVDRTRGSSACDLLGQSLDAMRENTLPGQRTPSSLCDFMIELAERAKARAASGPRGPRKRTLATMHRTVVIGVLKAAVRVIYARPLTQVIATTAEVLLLSDEPIDERQVRANKYRPQI